MKFKVFGKTNNAHARWVALETVEVIKKFCNNDLDVVKFYDIDKSIGHDIALEEKVSYVPTVICENDEGIEVDYIENLFAIGHGEMIKDMNMSKEWWRKLEHFVQDIIDNRDGLK